MGSIIGTGGIIYTPTYVELPLAYPRAVNNNGTIVGTFATENGGRACIIDATGNGNHINLGTLGFPDDDYSNAYDINNLGQIVGISKTVPANSQATLFDPNGSGNNIGLGGVAGGIQSEASAINDSGQIIGIANVGGENLAAIFDITGGGDNYDLNDLIDPSSGWVLRRAADINNDGWIVGDGSFGGDYTRAFLLIPVPEPYCSQKIPGDSNGDCCVNILDLSILCSHWLNCNLLPESACWK